MTVRIMQGDCRELLATLPKINPEYCAIAERRLIKDAGIFADLTVTKGEV